jgi:hypothetical protein
MLMHRSILIQWLTASLLALSVPLCCCQGLLGFMMAGSTVQSSATQTTTEQFAHESDTHSHNLLNTNHDDESAAASSQHSHDSGPCQDEGLCESENLILLAQPDYQMTSSLPASQSFSVKPAFTARSDRLSHRRAIPKNTTLCAGRPLASPLHLHCALMV